MSETTYLGIFSIAVFLLAKGPVLGKAASPLAWLAEALGNADPHLMLTQPWMDVPGKVGQHPMSSGTNSRGPSRVGAVISRQGGLGDPGS